MAPNSSDIDGASLEKKGGEALVESASASSLTDFGGDSKLPPPPQLTPEQERTLYRKVDLWLMPILTLMYLSAFLDRGTSCRSERSTHLNEFDRQYR